MFWGLILEPGKKYAQTIQRSFHISMASLDAATISGDEINSIQIEIDNKIYTLCSLTAKSTLQQSLDLNLESGTRVTFSTKGKSTAHLTGYLIPEDEELSDFDEDDEEEEDEDENAIAGQPHLIPIKRKLDNSIEQKAEKKPKLQNQKKEAIDDEDEDDDSDLSEEDESDEAPIKAEKPQQKQKKNQQQQKPNQQKKGQNNQQKGQAGTPKPQQEKKPINLDSSVGSSPGSAKKKRNKSKKGKQGKTNGV